MPRSTAPTGMPFFVVHSRAEHISCAVLQRHGASSPLHRPPRDARIALQCAMPRQQFTPEGPLCRLRMHGNTAAKFGAIRFAGSKRAPALFHICLHACDGYVNCEMYSNLLAYTCNVNSNFCF